MRNFHFPMSELLTNISQAFFSAFFCFKRHFFVVGYHLMNSVGCRQKQYLLTKHTCILYKIKMIKCARQHRHFVFFFNLFFSILKILFKYMIRRSEKKGLFTFPQCISVSTIHIWLNRCHLILHSFQLLHNHTNIPAHHHRRHKNILNIL